MDIQNNVFAVVSTIVDTVLDFENTDKNALAIHKRINNIEFNIKRYDEKRKTYMKCLELLEMAALVVYCYTLLAKFVSERKR